MPIEQVAFATVAKYQNRTVTATFERPTKPGSLLVAVDSTAGTIPSRVSTPNGFSSILASGLRDVQMNVWYRPNAPATSQVSCTALDDNKSHQLRVFELSGMAQTAVLDRVSFRSAEDRDPTTGDSGNTTQADEVAFAFVTNQYASTSQTSFAGGFTRLYETTSPQKWSGGTNQDWERARQSVHVAFPNTIQNFHLWCDLDTTRRWIACVVTFKTGTSGPMRMSSTVNTEGMKTVGSGQLTLFGPLQAKDLSVGMRTDTERARVGPFNYQYRVGGFDGLLIGSGTQYHVEGTTGLGGWAVRTSDEDLPRNDGALRGIDLQEAREVIFKMNVGKGREEVERNMRALYRALRIRRDEDIDLLFRFPTWPLMLLRCRPIDLQRERNRDQLQFAEQQFGLRAADPRIYAAIPKLIQIPVTPTAGDPLYTQVVNDGNSEAYPIIRVRGPEVGPPVTRIQLVNETALVAFEAELTLPKGSELVADMDARIRGSAESPITLDRQTKYGAWQLPREPFRIDADPTGFGGYNRVYLRTEPVNAAVYCTLEYRDTWAG